MSLHAFILAYRAELIEACRLRSSQRREQAWLPARAEGVAAFLDQLVEVLRSEEQNEVGATTETCLSPARIELGKAAARHGVFLLGHGYSTDLVVHEYGDICQAVTGLVITLEAQMTVNEFRILNRCLDDAIAEAVAAHGAVHLQHVDRREDFRASRLEAFADDVQRVTLIAINAHAALLTGKVGMNGATGALLGHSLSELLFLAEQARAAIVDAQVRFAE